MDDKATQKTQKPASLQGSAGTPLLSAELVHGWMQRQYDWLCYGYSYKIHRNERRKIASALIQGMQAVEQIKKHGSGR